jgi:hypothetical protein
MEADDWLKGDEKQLYGIAAN